MALALHLAPHPDDEMLGAPGTLLTLKDAGWTVVNLACSLGRSDQSRRRRRELQTACARTGLLLRLTAAPIAISSNDDLRAAEAQLTDEIAAAIGDLLPALVIGPSPHDAHHAHELVGRATHAAIARSRMRPRWWMWNLWADAPTPTLYVELGPTILERAAHGLAAHRGELERNAYQRLLYARSQVAAVLGVERVFGWGTSAPAAQCAEILTEVLSDRSEQWPLALPRRLCVEHALTQAQPQGVDLTRWLTSVSPRTALLGSPTTPR